MFSASNIAVYKLTIDDIMVDAKNKPVFCNLSEFELGLQINNITILQKALEAKKSFGLLSYDSLNIYKDIIWYLGDILYYITFYKPTVYDIIEDENSNEQNIGLEIQYYLPVEFVYLMDLCFKPVSHHRISLDQLHFKVETYINQPELTFDHINILIEMNQPVADLRRSRKYIIYEIALVVVAVILLHAIFWVVINVLKWKKRRVDTMTEPYIESQVF